MSDEPSFEEMYDDDDSGYEGDVESESGSERQEVEEAESENSVNEDDVNDTYYVGRFKVKTLSREPPG